MKKVTVLFLLLSISLNSVSQTIVKKHLSACDRNSIPHYLRNRIVSKRMSYDTLYLTIGFTGNCSIQLQPKLTGTNDTLFLELTNVSEIYAMCDCCFEVELTVTGVPDTNFVLIYPHHYSFFDKNMIEIDTVLNEILSEQSNKFIFPLEAEFRNVNTFNQLTPEGLRTGLWYKYDTTKVGFRKVITIKYASFFEPPKAGKEKAIWSVHLKEDGTVIGMSVKNPFQDSWMEMDGTTYYRLIGKTE